MSKPIAGGNDEPRASFNIPQDKLARFDSLCEDEGVSRSAKLRELVGQYVDRHTDDTHETPKQPPEEPHLREAYRTLYRLANDRKDSKLRVTKETTLNELYTNQVPKDSVMAKLIYPLQKRGYVDVTPAMNRVWLVL